MRVVHCGLRFAAKPASTSEIQVGLFCNLGRWHERFMKALASMSIRPQVSGSDRVLV